MDQRAAVTDDADACTTTCKNAACGDGIVQGKELCDPLSSPVTMRHAWLMIPLLLLAGCTGSAGSGGADDISLAVVVPPAVELGPKATLVVTLYGHDPNWADASATVIQTDAVALTPTLDEITIDFPADAHERIDQGNGPVAFEDARYYLVFYGDLDGDRQICAGELIQDYDNDGPYDFGPGAPGEMVKVPMRVADATYTCRSAYPDGA